MLQQSVSLLSAACSDLQKATFNIMFHPISSQVVLEPRTLAFNIFLKPVGTCAWTRTLGRPDSRRGNDGQRYAPRLQLLPWRVHHLHRRIPDDAPSTSRALHVSGQCCSLPRIQVAWKAPGCDLKAGMTFLVRESVFPGSSALEAGAAQSPADFLLGCISASTCTSYISYISSIPRWEVMLLSIE